MKPELYVWLTVNHGDTSDTQFSRSVQWLIDYAGLTSNRPRLQDLLRD